MALLACIAVGCASAPCMDQLAATVESGTGGRLGHRDDAAERGLPPGTPPFDRLTDDDAVAIALWNNKAFHESLATLGFQRADLLQAGQLTNPTLVTLFPAGPKQFQFTALMPIDALWLRPRRVAIAKIDLEAASKQLVASGLDLVRNVRVACIDLQLAEDRVDAASRSAHWQGKLAEVMRSRFEAGDVGATERDHARAGELLATHGLERLQRDRRIARERLGQLLGIGNATTHIAVRLPSISSGPLPAEEELFRRAMATRPELRGNELAMEAAAKRGKLSSAEALLVTPSVDVRGTPTGPQAGPGLNLTLPLFHRNPGIHARADAVTGQLLRRHLALRDRILLEVREARLRREHALKEWVLVRESMLPDLEAMVRRARLSHEAGDASPVLFMEAERRLADAQALLAEATAEVRRADAELARAVGLRFGK
jgi:cobalt-zinc-cadmium efflux system outer membrane protein